MGDRDMDLTFREKQWSWEGLGSGLWTRVGTQGAADSARTPRGTRLRGCSGRKECVPPNSCVEALILNVLVFGAGPLGSHSV